MTPDTIAAPSTLPGGGERAVVRTSGPRAFALAGLPRRRAARRLVLRLPGLRVPADAWTFPGPASATGEDVVEYHVPGAAPVVRALLDRLLARGARLAEPGEFTRRAYLNGKLDLARAEAVAAVIRAGSDAEYRAAAALLTGEWSRKLDLLADGLTSLAADLEASIDFVDQDIEILAPAAARDRLATFRESLGRLAADCGTAREGAGAPRVLLAGPPNAGKSTLFAALTGARAIASPERGTTRDLLEAACGPVTIVDAPGLDAAPAPGPERGAVGRARAEVERADLLLVAAAPGQDAPTLPAAVEAWRIATKSDLGGAAPRGAIRVSAATGKGLAGLKRRLAAWAEGATGPGARYLLSRRQSGLLGAARESLDRASAALERDLGPEFASMEIRGALSSLGGITGRDADADLLDRIFERFCLGK